MPSRRDSSFHIAIAIASTALSWILLAPVAAQAQDRHYLWIFSSQSVPKLPRYTHTWAAFARVGCCNGRRNIEAFTISWMPATLEIRPYAVRPEPGANLDLPTTLRSVSDHRERISVWGPYAISSRLYVRAIQQKQKLESGAVQYRAIDPVIRRSNISDCVHAVSDIAPGQTRINYIETVFFGDAAGRRIANAFRRLGLTCPVHEDLRWLEHALAMDDYPISRRD
jgi:hypothetical protein